MNIKGKAILEFVDVNTGEKRIEERDNFIFMDKYNEFFVGGMILYRPCIVYRGSATYPMLNRFSTYYGDFTSFAYTGYAPAGTKLKKYFPKTTESPAYWEFYSLFLPPATTSAVACLGLMSSSADNQSPWLNVLLSSILKTAINLNPPCYQSPTEYLNIYYRLIFLEDTEDLTNSEWVKEQFVLDMDRGAPKRFYQNDNIQMYPFTVTEDLGLNGNVNFLSQGYTSLGSKETVNPSAYNYSLLSARKIYNYPDGVPNQYNQINNTFTKSFYRAGRTRIDGYIAYLHPDNFVPEIGEGISGIGNVFGTATGTDSNYFDAAFFPLGSGKMFAAGQWNPYPLPRKYVAYVTQTGELAGDATYNVRRYGGNLDVGLNLFPYTYYSSDFNAAKTNYYVTAKNNMYGSPEKVHFSKYMRKFIDGRAFITWDSTGITIYDIYKGKLTSFDAYSDPIVGVTDVKDVKVDSDGNIWIACANTGLWKITITSGSTTVTQIGALPGCQQKCYALDVDNFGNVWAIFWGLGLHYTIDGGTTWVNAIINYTPFSDFDETGTNSKWRFCSRLVCNKFRDASNGDGQILLTVTSNHPDVATTSGCWYDQISADVVGITNATLRTSLTRLRNDGPKENIVMSEFQDKWLFYGNSTEGIRWVPFKHNAAANSITGTTISQTNIYAIHYEKCWDETSGTWKEYVYNCRHLQYYLYHTPGCIIDVATNTVVKYGLYGTADNYSYGLNEQESNAIMISKNFIIQFEMASPPGNSTYELRFVLRGLFPATKEYKTWNSDLLGWNGSAWQVGHPGSRACHLTSEPLEDGINLQFENGLASTTSFVAGDQYTFTCFDGYYKDNSSKMWVKDTIYLKPKTTETTFSPNTVTLYDKSAEIGILNSAEINVDWNIDELPDTTYEGQPLVLDGDQFYPYVQYLNYFEEVGSFGMKDEKFNQPPTTIVGDLTPSLDVPIFVDNPTSYFDGESGIFYSAQTRYSMGSGNFTIDMWIKPDEFNVTEQILVDFRGAAAEMGALFINTVGQLAWTNGTTTYGQTGASVVVDQWNFVTLTRKTGNLWEMTLNGISIATWTDAAGFISTRSLHVGKRFAITTSWIPESVVITSDTVMNPSGVQTADTISANTSNVNTHTFYRYATISAGTYTSSIFAKKGTRRYFILRTGINNVDIRSVYDFDTDTFVTTGAGHTLGKEVLTNGWVRLWVTMTESTNNVSRYFSWGPTGQVNPATTWVGVANEESCYVWGAMLKTGTTPGTYTPSGSIENMWVNDSENFGGNWRGFRGSMSNFRLTSTISRYDGNITVPTDKFKNVGFSYEGARLRLPGNYLQGSIMAKKELVGNWTVVFRDLPTWFRETDGGRPKLAFGITTTPSVTCFGDIAYRFLQGSNDTLLFQTWLSGWSAGNQGSTYNAIRFRKVGTVIFIDASASNGIFWTQIYSYNDFAGIHYIAFWQEKPSSDNILKPLYTPSVEIVANGSDYITRVGSEAQASGLFHPKFLAVDSYWESDFIIKLNGVLTTKNRSNYQAEALPLEGECYMHQHGTIRFHAADVGKVITGKVMALHD
jgi:hypothetical protein